MTVRHSDHRNASRSCAGFGSGGWWLYYLYALERVGRMSGQRYFVTTRQAGGRGPKFEAPQPHDWYREGCEYLLTGIGKQDPLTHEWRGIGPVEGMPEIYIVSNVKLNGEPIGSLGAGEAVWHTDMSYLEAPPIASALYALEIPPVGGNTSFSTGKDATNFQRQVNLIDNVAISAGSHQLKFGVDYRRLTPVYGRWKYKQFASFNGVEGVRSGIASSVAAVLTFLSGYAIGSVLTRR